VTGDNERDEKTPAPSERPLTRGERLKREREAKAKAKVEKRGREAEKIQDRAIEVAEQAREATQEIMRESGGKIALVLIGALAILVTIAVVRDMVAGAHEEKARALTAAEAIDAPSERASALGSLAEENAGTALANWARLGEAAARLQEGDAEAAERIYANVSEADGLGALERRLALEGLAAARLQKGDSKGALAAFERLAQTDDAHAQNTAELGRARILAAEGKRAEAKELVDGVIARLKEAGRQSLGFTNEEAESLAAALQGG
jgi:predicted negative regulator of RcsB-dependent stress response